jgi:hypothetical protein
LEEILGQLKWGRGYYLPEIPAALLAGAAAGAAAEEVAHSWNFFLTGLGPRNLTPERDLKMRILREAVGFYGSRALVPERPFWHPGELDAPLGTRLGRLQALVREALAPRFSLAPGVARELYQTDLESYLGLAHLVGYMLGGSWPWTPELAQRAFLTPPWGKAGEDFWEAAWDWLA